MRYILRYTQRLQKRITTLSSSCALALKEAMPQYQARVKEDASSQGGARFLGKLSSKTAFYAMLTLGGVASGLTFFDYGDFGPLRVANLAGSCTCDDNPSGKPSGGSSSSPAIAGNNTKYVKSELDKLHNTHRSDLPTYTLDEVRQNNSKDKRVWITFGVGVYDITDYIALHPGADQVMMSAGGSVDLPFATYMNHSTSMVLELMEKYRIGNISQVDAPKDMDMVIEEIWSTEPPRHPEMIPLTVRPWNAGVRFKTLGEKFFTPPEFFYVRNHLPVPPIDLDTYELTLEVETDQTCAKVKRRTLTFDQIKSLPKTVVTSGMMCGGARRAEMFAGEIFYGPSWRANAMGNARWGGVRLRDVLLAMGVRPNDKLHVHFEGADFEPGGTPYGSSITLNKAMCSASSVLLCYEMNGKPLPPDHGYPLRVIIPGVMGGRSVKWLTRVAVCDHESQLHYQQREYKCFSPNTDFTNADWANTPPVMEMPVNSAICYPEEDDNVAIGNDGCIHVNGYAWSGGGRRINRVDVTADGGNTWQTAELEQENVPDGIHFGWSLWSARVPVTKAGQVELWVKAIDGQNNTQPESWKMIRNFRGVCCNAYHRVKINAS